jgi:hypothetical protein
VWVEGERLHPPPESQTGGNFALIFPEIFELGGEGKPQMWIIAG